MNKFSPNNFGHLLPDQDGTWVRYSDVAPLERKIAEMEAAAVINERYCAEAVERCARACEKRAEERFAEYGITEYDTNATYYSDDEYEIKDEEDAACAQAIRALSPLSTDSKSMTKRLDIQREEK